jgi:hypothetical protein
MLTNLFMILVNLFDLPFHSFYFIKRLLEHYHSFPAYHMIRYKDKGTKSNLFYI